MTRAVFELKIWQKDDHSCFFLLLWDDRKKQLTASLSGSRDVQRWYQCWQQRYFRFYLPSPRAIGNSGRLNPGSGDPGNDLREAETEFLHAFQRWLGEGETRKIQQRIRDELMRLVKQEPKQGKASFGIDLLLACDSPEMARLPWEAWELAPEEMPVGTVRVIRTAMDRNESSPVARSRRSRKARILTILAEDPNLPLQEHWKSLRSLRSIAEVDRVTWLSDEDPVVIKTRIAHAICDQRGWDILFFTGHSDETAVTGGRFAIAPNLSFSISELEEQLAQAKERGLQLAIFNSCSGLSIAHALIDLGVQVVAMREPIRNDVAQSFLKHLCKELNQHQDILDALTNTRYYLQFSEKFAFPSAYLLPSFFSPPDTLPFRIEPLGWKRWFQPWLSPRDWVPTLAEAIALGILLLLSTQDQVQDFLLEQRVFVQTNYRLLTNQVPNTPPPVSIVAIDQESLDRAKLKPWPLDREYLGKLVKRLSDLHIKVIGIDYYVAKAAPKDEILVKFIQAAIDKQSTWFVFAVRDQESLRETFAKWSLPGDTGFFNWLLELPKDTTCVEVCPFGYSLAIAKTLSEQPFAPQPELRSKSNFQLTVSGHLRRNKQVRQNNTLSLLTKPAPPFDLYHIIDFSIPPDQVYHRIPAWRLLDPSTSTSELQQSLQQSIAIIATGGYAEAEDNFAAPLAFRYWCLYRPQKLEKQANCSNTITGGEVHAYMVHHLLSSHRVLQIPDWWIVGIAALVGKGIALVLIRQSAKQQKKQALIVIGATAVYGLVALQSYISASVLIPWFLPVVLVWADTLLALKRKAYR